MSDKYKQHINDLELAVRTIEDILPEMPTKGLQKWQGILRTALLKVEQELKASIEHTCQICFLKEWGYRDELPSSWYKKGNAEICFQHEYDQAEKLLKDAGYTEDAEADTEIPVITPEALMVSMKHLPDPPSETEQTLEDLMAAI